MSAATSQPSFGELFPITLAYFKESFERFKENLIPSIKVIGPYLGVMVVFGIIMGILMLPMMMMDSSSSASSDAAMAAAGLIGIVSIVGIILLIPISLYFFFVQYRFIVLAHQQSSQDLSLGKLWGFDNTFWGFLGLLLVLGLIYIPVYLLAIVGFILLIVPGVAVIMAYLIYSLVALFAYLDNPSIGIGGALGKGAEILKADWQRWTALFLIMIGAGIVISIPVMIIYTIFALIPLVGFVVQLALQVLMMLVGLYTLFVYYRCYQDSKAALGMA